MIRRIPADLLLLSVYHAEFIWFIFANRVKQVEAAYFASTWSIPVFTMVCGVLVEAVGVFRVINQENDVMARSLIADSWEKMPFCCYRCYLQPSKPCAPRVWAGSGNLSIFTVPLPTACPIDKWKWKWKRIWKIPFSFPFLCTSVQNNAKEIREIAGRKACNTNGFTKSVQLMQ